MVNRIILFERCKLIPHRLWNCQVWKHANCLKFANLLFSFHHLVTFVCLTYTTIARGYRTNPQCKYYDLIEAWGKKFKINFWVRLMVDYRRKSLLKGETEKNRETTRAVCDIISKQIIFYWLLIFGERTKRGWAQEGLSPFIELSKGERIPYAERSGFFRWYLKCRNQWSEHALCSKSFSSTEKNAESVVNRSHIFR